MSDLELLNCSCHIFQAGHLIILMPVVAQRSMVMFWFYINHYIDFDLLIPWSAYSTEFHPDLPSASSLGCTVAVALVVLLLYVSLHIHRRIYLQPCNAYLCCCDSRAQL